jgi:hypothetical protein
MKGIKTSKQNGGQGNVKKGIAIKAEEGQG